LLFSFRHPSITVSRVRHDESTSNLKHHVRQCTPPDSVEARKLAEFVQGSTYTAATHRMKVALWVARRHRPFAIVEDPELLDIFHDLNNKCTTPSASTVSRDVKEIFQITRVKVAEMLQVGSMSVQALRCTYHKNSIIKANYILAWTAGHLLKHFRFWGLQSTGSQVERFPRSFWIL
jgi:hypothetical protein